MPAPAAVTVTLTLHGIAAGQRLRDLTERLSDIALEVTPANAGFALECYAEAEAEAEAGAEAYPPPLWASA